MIVQDISQNRRIQSLRKLTRELEKSPTPEQTLHTLHRGFEEAYGFVASLLLSTRELPEGEYRVVRTQLEGGRDEFPGLSPYRPGPVRCGGIVAEIIARHEPQLIQDVDWAADPFFHTALAEYGSVMAIPLGGDHLPMTWAFFLKRRPNRFNVSDLEEVMQRAALTSALLENQILAGQLALANEKIDRDAKDVGELQRALLPASVPQIAGLEIAVSYQPSGRAGGDFFDFFPLGEGCKGYGNDTGAPARWCVFIGDAAGHGLAPAVVMAMLQSMLHAHPVSIAGPASLLVHANRQLCEKRIGGFVTAFLGIYEPQSRRLTYVNAGHPPPLVKRSTDELIRQLNAVATYPLGIDASETFKEATVQLQAGDTVLLFTDGITEVRDTERSMLGLDRLTRLFRDEADRPAEIVARIRKVVDMLQEGQTPRDDQTLVAARVL